MPGAGEWVEPFPRPLAFSGDSSTHARDVLPSPSQDWPFLTVLPLTYLGFYCATCFIRRRHSPVVKVSNVIPGGATIAFAAARCAS